jgi:agmatinase
MADIKDLFGGGGGGFMGLPVGSLQSIDAEIAILGVPVSTPYAATGPYCAGGPEAIRKAAAGYSGALAHMDFDVGGPLLHDGKRRAVDFGDIAWDATDFAGNRARIREAVRSLLVKGAVPVVLGGDDSIPIPVLEAYSCHGPISILQIDAHIDWRDEVGGERMGLSSTMRRASEMSHVERIVQIGQRGIGSARPSDVQDAEAWGVTFVPAHRLHSDGITAALVEIPDGASVFINLDVDALDPSVMPAVIGPAPGGLSFQQVTGLLHEVATRTRIAGFSIVELVADKDHSGISALTAARIVCNVIGILARAP